MYRSKNSQKIIAAIFLFAMLANLLTPVTVLALTSGPTAPEATSFEPVDTSDAVNLQTGDFTYNIPLIEVPGPEGSYPLSLSYHAGIEPNEDASWVGLGWSLNPGAINRNVNGFPDDWLAKSNNSHVYWQGGLTQVYTVGLAVGQAGTPANVTFGLSFSNDTYKGFSAGLDLRYGVPGGSMHTGVDPYGDTYVSGEMNVSVLGIASSGIGFRASNSTGFTTRLFDEVNIGTSMLGATINTRSGQVSAQFGGLQSSVYNSNSGRVSTATNAYGAAIPIYKGLALALGYSKTRYWTDEKVDISVSGSLNSYNQTFGDNTAFDAYSLMDNTIAREAVGYPDANIVQGGAFPDFDVYSVNAQGLSGNMRPYLFQGVVKRQNLKRETTPLVTYYSPQGTPISYAPKFRFESDFTNSYRQAYNSYNPSNAGTFDLLSAAAPFDAAPAHGQNDGNYGGNGYDNTLAGSKHVDVNLRVKPSQAMGYVKNDRFADGMIEGYSITNETGVTYHFGLPAYSYGEIVTQQRKADAEQNFNRITRAAPYAYTWYLTTMTGPDYVDRNGNGIADEGDWGYWVNFEYGKWASDYVWRNPSEGYHADEDNLFRNYSVGHKEIYYLNAVKTRTHTALFEKDVRDDAKGEAAAAADMTTSDKKDGAFDATSAQSMRLNRIYLLRTQDGNFSSYGTGYNSNIFERVDLNATQLTNMQNASLKIIDFSYDYSLCPRTNNSFLLTSPSVKNGKLTLKSVTARGRGGVQVLPPVKFDYEQEDTEKVTIAGGALLGQVSGTQVQVGDLLVSDDVAKDFVGVVTSKVAGAQAGVFNYTLYGGELAVSASKNYRTTKNPPYKKDAYDMWGMFKSDFNAAVANADENIGRATSSVSARNTDVWSLRKITTALGASIKIRYESDTYVPSPVSSTQSLVITDVSQSGNIFTFKANKPNADFKIDGTYTVGDKLNAIICQGFYNADPNNYIGFGGVVVTDTRNNKLSSVITPLDPFNAFRSVPASQRTVDGGFVIQSVTESGNEVIITTQCTDAFVNGTGSVFISMPWSNTTTTFPVKADPSRGGNIYVLNKNGEVGGNIRIKSLSLSEPFTGIEAITSYGYNAGADKLITSGVSSFEPRIYEKFQINYPGTWGGAQRTAFDREFKKSLYRNLNSLYAISRELPPPGVMYEFVTVTKQVKNVEEPVVNNLAGATEFQFEVFKPYMIYRGDATLYASYNSNNTFRNLYIKKMISGLGNTLRISQYDVHGKKLMETINHYLHDDLRGMSPEQFMPVYQDLVARYSYQGNIHERYLELKKVENQTYTADNGVKATMSSHENYPCIQTGQTVYNYVNGARAETENIEFDFYTGLVSKSVETDVYGNRILTEIVPAYRKYSAMGLKINNVANKNMLTQTAETYVYKVSKSNTRLGLISANVETWSNTIPVFDIAGNSIVQNGAGASGNVWRKEAKFSWLPDTKTAGGLTAMANFPASADFNWTTPASSNASWKKQSQVTLYDVYSKGLEGYDMSGNYAATHMSYNSRQVDLSGVNAKYAEVAFSGAEDDNINNSAGGFVWKDAGAVTTDVSHTGKKALSIAASGNRGFTYSVNTDNLVPGRDYSASVWVYRGAANSLSTTPAVQLYYQVNGVIKGYSQFANDASARTAGNWVLLTLAIKGTDITAAGTLKVGCQHNGASLTAVVDDFKFQPLNAPAIAYVYDDVNGLLLYTLGANNLYIRYEYDAEGRLTAVYRERLGTVEQKMKEYKYNMGQL